MLFYVFFFLPASSQLPSLKWLNDSWGHFHTYTCCWAQNQFGEFQAVSLPEAFTAIFHSPSAAHQCETRPGLLFCWCLSGAAIWSGFCSSHFIGFSWCSGNEWETGLWKGRESNGSRKKTTKIQNISLFSWPEWYFVIFGMFPWIIHAWLVTAKKTAGVTVHFQNLEFIKLAFFIHEKTNLLFFQLNSKVNSKKNVESQGLHWIHLKAFCSIMSCQATLGVKPSARSLSVALSPWLQSPHQ